MKAMMDPMGRSGLEFFGMITATISHEIKNVLAIINENAGLMNDLTFMARKGKPLDIDKIASLADRFSRQVARADDIIQNMNRFAHSVDNPVEKVDAGDILKLTIALAERLISTRGVTINLTLPDAPVHITTSPFFLNTAFWYCLEYAMDAVGEKKAIDITIKNEASNININFKGLSDVGPSSERPLLTKKRETVLNFLSADLSMNENAHSIILTLPSGL